MRRHNQLWLDTPWIDHPHAEELAAISGILDLNPGMAEAIVQDLIRGLRNPDTGKPGMSGDQVLRVLLLKQMKCWSYDDLHFHLMDSATFRTFCRFGALATVPSRSAIATNVKKVRPETLERINRILLEHAKQEKVETGRKVRIDATVVETNIHAPTDSSLLYDGVRVIVRLLGKVQDRSGFTLWSNHSRRAKRRMLAVQNAKSVSKRTAAYRDLLKVAKKTTGYAEVARASLAGTIDIETGALVGELETITGWLWVVIDQTERRVLFGEQVPAEEKLVSIFEPHTDIIIKDRRETYYGHKVTLTGGASGLILDCVIESGNPADSTRAITMLERQTEIYGRPPRQASLDGGYASKANLAQAKAIGVQDVCFAKSRGLDVTEMVKSSWVYQRLRNFRAGIEGMISFLKRAFGLDRCTWKGAVSFGSYVWGSIVSANLLILARHTLS
jgi:transposase, IS5 family